MRNKKLLALLLVLTLVFAVSGCSSKKVDKKDSTVETTEEREILDDNSSTKEDDSDKTDVSETIEDESNSMEDNGSSLDKNESEHSNKNSTSGSGTDNSGSANNSGGANGSTNSGNSGSTGSTNNTGNNNNSGSSNNNSGSSNTGSTNTQTKPIHEHTWTEVTEDEIHYYAWRTLCGKCNADLTDLSGTDRAYHTTVLCRSGYSTHYIEVDFVTENVVKTPVVVGYKCSCGAEKE
ncbi:MAG: hypothetical protein IJA19_04950 [Clostridia bacterium]|nr:hypothetical protein [Clostridia bacterium]